MLIHKEIESSPVNVTDGVGPRPHHGGVGSNMAANRAACDGVFANPSRRGCLDPAGALSSAVSRTRGRCSSLMELLLVAKQQISPRKTPCALRAFKWFFFRM